MPSKISTDIALLVFLFAIVAAIVFPVLGNMPISDDEAMLLDRMAGAGSAGSIAGVFGSDSNIFVEAYVHMVLLIHGLLPMLGDMFVLRLPGALVVMTLTLCLFRFGGRAERYNASFLASLLFLSSALIMRMTFNVSVTVVPAALFIFALMSLYHRLHRPGRHTFWLVVFSAALATVLIGATVPIALALMAYVFLLASRRGSVRQFVMVTVALSLACGAAFLTVYVIVGDVYVAKEVFDIRQQLAVVPGTSSMTYVFVNYIIFAIFPWSIPLIISLPWLVRRPGKVYRRFLDLTLLQRYSIIVFLFSLPFFFFVTDLTLVLLVASMFFNMPLFGRYMLLQFSHHHVTWKVSGYVFAFIVALFAVMLVVLQSGVEIPFGKYRVSLDAGCDGWCVALLVMVVLGLYTLWRNAREIGNNNRFLYNIIFLYTVSAIICVGYVVGRLSVYQQL